MKSTFYLPKLVIVFSFCAIILASCKSSKTQQDSTAPTKDLTELAEEKYGPTAAVTYNKSKTHALVQHIKKDKNAAFASVKFFVYEEETRSIILEDFINQGSVKWLNDNQINISITSGAYQEGSSNGYLFDVQSGEKTPK